MASHLLMNIFHILLLSFLKLLLISNPNYHRILRKLGFNLCNYLFYIEEQLNLVLYFPNTQCILVFPNWCLTNKFSSCKGKNCTKNLSYKSLKGRLSRPFVLYYKLINLSSLNIGLMMVHRKQHILINNYQRILEYQLLLTHLQIELYLFGKVCSWFLQTS